MVVIVDQTIGTDLQKSKKSEAEFFEKSGMGILGAMSIHSTMVEQEPAYAYKFVNMVV